MNGICRLCLNVSSSSMQNLFENEELLWKISSCLKVKIRNNELLPNRVCSPCIDKVDGYFNFQKKVKENQHLLSINLELGENYFQSFYSSLNVEVKEEKEIIEKHEQVTLLVKCDESVLAKEDEVKSEHTDLDQNNYSSDDNVTLSTIKTVKKRKRHKTAKVRKKKVGSKNTLSKTNCTFNNKTHEALENIDTGIEQKTVSVTDEILEENNDLVGNNEKQETTEPANDLNDDSFKCLVCFKLHNCHEALKAHYYSAHQPPRTEIKYDDLYVKDGAKFKCKKCEKSFPRIGEMRRHALVKHAESRPYVCKICGKTFKDIPTIMRHSRAHGGGERMACSYHCGYTTVYKSNLKDHETRLHKNDYKYKCLTCGKGFIVKTWYEEHQNIHSGAKPFVCDICGVAYPLNKYLAHHRFMVHPETAEVKRFHCLHCAHPCDSKNALKEHLSKAHGIKSSFLCNICGKTFARYTAIKAHEAIHTGVKPHVCGICKKPFKTPQRLRNHEKIHSRAKNYVCLKCVKGYPTEVALNRHIARQHKV